MEDSLKDWGKVVERLQKEFPEKEFALDGNDEASVRKMEAQPPIRRGDDLAIYNNEKTLPLGFEKMITSLKPRFEKNDVEILDAEGRGVVKAQNVLLVTGYKNEDFKALVEGMIDEGKLAGKIVVFLSCGEGQEDSFNSDLLSAPKGPAMVLYYTERIYPEAVRRLMTRLARLVNDKEVIGAGDTPHRVAHPSRDRS